MKLEGSTTSPRSPPTRAQRGLLRALMGLRMVKKTVNQDDPSVYHLFYADEHGTPART